MAGERIGELFGGPMDGAKVPILDDALPLPKEFAVIRGEQALVYLLRPPGDKPVFDFSKIMARPAE